MADQFRYPGMSAVLVSAFAPTIDVLIFGRLFGGFAAGMAYPTILALIMALKHLPPHVNETSDKVDHIGGILSLVLVGSFLLAINFAPVSSMHTLVIGMVVESNWLPTHQICNFQPIRRMYQPKQPLLDGSHLLPAIQHISGSK